MSLLAPTYFLSCKTTMLVLHYCPLNALDRAHLASRQCMLLFMIYFMFAYNMYVTYDRLYYQTTCGSWEDSVSIEKIIYFQSQMSFNIGARHFCFHVPKKMPWSLPTKHDLSFPTLHDMANSIWNWSLSSFLPLH